MQLTSHLTSALCEQIHQQMNLNPPTHPKVRAVISRHVFVDTLGADGGILLLPLTILWLVLELVSLIDYVVEYNM